VFADALERSVDSEIVTCLGSDDDISTESDVSEDECSDFKMTFDSSSEEESSSDDEGVFQIAPTPLVKTSKFKKLPVIFEHESEEQGRCDALDLAVMTSDGHEIRSVCQEHKSVSDVNKGDERRHSLDPTSEFSTRNASLGEVIQRNLKHNTDRTLDDSNSKGLNTMKTVPVLGARPGYYFDNVTQTFKREASPDYTWDSVLDTQDSLEDTSIKEVPTNIKEDNKNTQKDNLETLDSYEDRNTKTDNYSHIDNKTTTSENTDTSTNDSLQLSKSAKDATFLSSRPGFYFDIKTQTFKREASPDETWDSPTDVEDSSNESHDQLPKLLSAEKHVKESVDEDAISNNIESISRLSEAQVIESSVHETPTESPNVTAVKGIVALAARPGYYFDTASQTFKRERSPESTLDSGVDPQENVDMREEDLKTVKNPLVLGARPGFYFDHVTKTFKREASPDESWDNVPNLSSQDSLSETKDITPVITQPVDPEREKAVWLLAKLGMPSEVCEHYQLDFLKDVLKIKMASHGLHNGKNLTHDALKLIMSSVFSDVYTVFEQVLEYSF
jgi:hypothetical protein